MVGGTTSAFVLPSVKVKVLAVISAPAPFLVPAPAGPPVAPNFKIVCALHIPAANMVTKRQSVFILIYYLITLYTTQLHDTVPITSG
ncbi:hypothetical protein D3C80_1460210 [compost metagenome]